MIAAHYTKRFPPRIKAAWLPGSWNVFSRARNQTVFCVKNVYHSFWDEKMNTKLSEEEMREALFGVSNTPAPEPTPEISEPVVVAKPQPSPKPRPVNKALSPKLRVTLNVTKEFEGEVEVFVYDANTLSTLVAEQEAKNEAKKRKFRYFDVVSIKPI